MKEGQITTLQGEQHEIKSIGNYYATTYILDEQGQRFKLYGKLGYLTGRITIKQPNIIQL